MTSSTTGGFGFRLSWGAPTILAGAVAVIWVLDLVSGGMLTSLFAWSNGAAAQGQIWRGLTYVLVSGSFFSAVINVLMIILIGGALESITGQARMIALYFLSALGGAAAIAVAGGPSAVTIGATSAIFGLLAANAMLKYRQGMDIRPDLILFALFLVLNLVMGGLLGSFVGLFGLVGGIVGGVLGGFAIGWAAGRGAARERSQWLWLGAAALVLVMVTAAGLTL